MIFAAGSPQETWRVFESHYAVKSEHEREIVEDEWNELRQNKGENIMSFYGRAKTIRMKLESYGDKRPDASMCKHVTRRMLPSLKLCSGHVLPLPDRWSRTMEDLLGRASRELERHGRSGEEREETRHALTAAGVGRGDRGGKNAGDRGYGERDRTYTYCAHHGEGQGHNTPECIVMRRELDRYYGDFQEYLQLRGLGPYAGRGGRRGAEGKYRQQPYSNDSGARWSRSHRPEQQRTPPPGHGPGPGGYANTYHQPYPNDSGARWSRGHLPEQQRTPPPGHGPGPGGYANTFPRGRGHDRHHHSGGRGRGRGEGFGQVPSPNFPSNSTPNSSPNVPPGKFPNAPRHAFAADYPYENECMGYSGWGEPAGHWSSPPHTAELGTPEQQQQHRQHQEQQEGTPPATSISATATLSSPAPGAAQASGAPLQLFIARSVKIGKSESGDSVAVDRDGVVRGSVIGRVEPTLITRFASALR